MRLGAYPCRLEERTLALEAYGKKLIYERHRHRYEFNNAYMDALAKTGIVYSGVSPDQELVEIIELKDHPWFLGCQFHPEFKSKPMDPHPLFREFIRASLRYESKKVSVSKKGKGTTQSAGSAKRVKPKPSSIPPEEEVEEGERSSI
jgi:CTP synthase